MLECGSEMALISHEVFVRDAARGGAGPNRIKPCFAEREAQARPDIGPHHHHSRGRAKLCLPWPWPLFTMKGGHYCQDDTAPRPGAPRVKW